MSEGKRHPLPASDEARHDQIPEQLAREKGVGDDSKPIVQPAAEAVDPAGETYRSGDHEQQQGDQGDQDALQQDGSDQPDNPFQVDQS